MQRLTLGGYRRRLDFLRRAGSRFDRFTGRAAKDGLTPCGESRELPGGFCDYAQLNPQEERAVRSAPEANNFMDCFHGFSDCDKTQLTVLEQQEVARAHRIQGACDTTLLTDKQPEQVAEIARVRNFQSCLDGTGIRDRSQLTEDQKRKVEEANHFNNLQNGLEGMDDCNRAPLSSEEQQEVGRTTGGFGTASTVRMPAIARSLAEPSQLRKFFGFFALISIVKLCVFIVVV